MTGQESVESTESRTVCADAARVSGKVAYSSEASGSEPFGGEAGTVRGYVTRRAEAIRRAGLHTWAEFKAFRSGWESWAVDDNARLGWWWL